MERIEINGEWYVKETNSKPLPIEIETSKFKGVAFECKDYAFEATMIEKDDGTYYDGVDIKFTDKRPDYKDWKEEYWDNNNWFIGVLEDVPESLEDLKKSDIDIPTVKVVFQKLVDMGWLKK